MKTLTITLLAVMYSVSSIAQTKIELSWDKQIKSGPSWTETTVREVSKNFETLNKADDISLFCPAYGMLDRDHRIWVWSELVANMALFESNWKPTVYLHEPELGTDAVTGKTVVSQGLLQLGYGDTKWANWCKFNWEEDKDKSLDDPTRTVNDPHINLACGIGILSNQIKTRGRILTGKGAYWAVLKPKHKYNKIDKIQDNVKKLPFCGANISKHREAKAC